MNGTLETTPAQAETIGDAQQSIVDGFQFIDDWTERYQYLIELGRQLPSFPKTERTEANRLYGCQAGVWFTAVYRNGRIDFEATSDSAIVAGLIALLLRVYSGRKPDEILAAEPVFISEIGLAEHLSPHRSNGLALMLARIRSFAMAYVPHSSASEAHDQSQS